MLLLAWPAAATAAPASGPRETVDITVTTTAPATSAGLTYAAAYHAAGDPGGDPQALRRIAVLAPAGTRVDTTVPDRCAASDQQLELMGDAACPPGSRVGSGQVTVKVLGGPPSTYPTSVFNADHAQLELVKSGDRGIAVARSTIDENGNIDGEVPTCITGGTAPSGCPFDQSALISQKLTTEALAAGSRAYLRTPPSCPASGSWETRVLLTYADGVTDAVTPQQPCAAAAGGGTRRACASRRVVRLRHLGRLRSATATVRGRRRHLDPARPAIDLRGLPPGVYTVRIVARTVAGRRIALTRRYRTCAA
jgi:hypothetical protein